MKAMINPPVDFPPIRTSPISNCRKQMRDHLMGQSCQQKVSLSS